MYLLGHLVWTLAVLLLWVTQKRPLPVLNQRLQPGRLCPQISDLTMFQGGRDDEDLLAPNFSQPSELSPRFICEMPHRIQFHRGPRGVR